MLELIGLTWWWLLIALLIGFILNGVRK